MSGTTTASGAARACKLCEGPSPSRAGGRDNATPPPADRRGRRIAVILLDRRFTLFFPGALEAAGSLTPRQSRCRGVTSMTPSIFCDSKSDTDRSRPSREPGRHVRPQRRRNGKFVSAGSPRVEPRLPPSSDPSPGPLEREAARPCTSKFPSAEVRPMSAGEEWEHHGAAVGRSERVLPVKSISRLPCGEVDHEGSLTGRRRLPSSRHRSRSPRRGTRSRAPSLVRC